MDDMEGMDNLNEQLYVCLNPPLEHGLGQIETLQFDVNQLMRVIVYLLRHLIDNNVLTIEQAKTIAKG